MKFEALGEGAVRLPLSGAGPGDCDYKMDEIHLLSCPDVSRW